MQVAYQYDKVDGGGAPPSLGFSSPDEGRDGGGGKPPAIQHISERDVVAQDQLPDDQVRGTW